jgi:hypothetical protein
VTEKNDQARVDTMGEQSSDSPTAPTYGAPPPEDWVPETLCPNCLAWVPDLDGFGVLAHDACGYCSHPSSDDGVCGICGEQVE